VAFCLATEFQRKFGGDTVAEFTDAVARYRASVHLRISR
jgi:hypothetical protein